MMIANLSKGFGAVAVSLLLSSCVSIADNYPVNPDKMRANQPLGDLNEQVTSSADPQLEGAQRVNRLPAITGRQSQQNTEVDLSRQFASNDLVQVSANQLSLRGFVQTVFADTLKVNYIVADSVNDSSVTLNLQDPVSSRQLFNLTNQLLKEQGLQITKREDVFFIHPMQNAGAADVTIGLGRRASDVPDTINTILQIIPLRYGVKASVERTLRGLTAADITADMEQNAFFVRGSRQEVLKVIDLVSLLDIPSTRGRYVGLMQLTFVTPEEFVKSIDELLQAEGISTATRPANGAALLMVPISHIGAVALFAGDEFVLDRAEFWANQLDKPAKGVDKRYYIYHPRFARATDLGQSLAPLIGVSANIPVNTSRDTRSAQPTTDASNSNSAGISVAGDNIRMTVDERSNSIIFYTTGDAYQALLPIVQRLDVLPKQILLDATIAEVTLTDEFAQGFEFAFRSGKLSGGTLGAFGVGEMSGLRFNWTDGVANLIARLSASTSLVNVLSNPTLVVRDGVAASITVGNDIPTVGSTTINPGTDTQSTTVVYRKTGVNLSVTPTINAQGLVVLQIDQSISNTSSTGPQLAGSPSVFERSIKTEVIAQSGQTILLGGLISENNSNGGSHVPGVSRVPLLGYFFKGQEQRREKTELVVFITPRVIDSVSQWDEIRNKIAESLTSISLSD